MYPYFAKIILLFLTLRLSWPTLKVKHRLYRGGFDLNDIFQKQFHRSMDKFNYSISEKADL